MYCCEAMTRIAAETNSKQKQQTAAGCQRICTHLSMVTEGDSVAGRLMENGNRCTPGVRGEPSNVHTTKPAENTWGGAGGRGGEHSMRDQVKGRWG